MTEIFTIAEPTDPYPVPSDDRAGLRVAQAIVYALDELKLRVEDVTAGLDPTTRGRLYGLAEALTAVWPYLRRFAPTRDAHDDAYHAREILAYAVEANQRVAAWLERNQGEQ